MCWDALALPFASGCRDGILCTEVIEHVTDPAGMRPSLRACWRRRPVLLTRPSRAPPRRAADYWRCTEKFGLRLLFERAGLACCACARQRLRGGFCNRRYLLLQDTAPAFRRASFVWLLQTVAMMIGFLDATAA